MLPAIAALMSPSSGLGVVASRAAADMICPDWHRSRETEYIAKNPKQWHIRRDLDVKRFAIDGQSDHVETSLDAACTAETLPMW